MSRRKKKNIFNNKKIIYSALIAVLILVAGSSFVAGYYIATNKTTTKVVKDTKKDTVLKELQKLVDENINKQYEQKNEQKKKIVKKEPQKHNPPKKIAKQEPKKPITPKKLVNSEAMDYKENSKSEKEIIKPVIYTAKPKLVIIMDDMSFYSQIKNLKKLGIKVTPSFFPPSKRHPKTAIYAKEFKHYMVHFPMQATNPNFHEEVNTLHIDSSNKFIEERVKYIKKEFPKVKFVNNHTGSKFTENYNAMNRLYTVLDKYHIIFVDSRTTSKTKASLIAKKHKDILISRDVFLDNKPNISYIQGQLKQAIRIAKKRGYAIAICHPHPKTFEALAKSKSLLKNVEVVYIDELYKLYQTHKLSKL
jgi:polysaccharide deacetylase 2 family uncharacterized protein YibQ